MSVPAKPINRPHRENKAFRFPSCAGLTYRTAGGALLGAVTYDYDAGGRVLRRGGSLAPARLPAPTRVDATYDLGNRMTAFDGAALRYDANGNLTADGTRSFTWNARNQLQSMTYAGGTATFVYDPVGRRLRKTVNGTVTKFLYDGLDPVGEATGTTAVTRLAGLGLDEWFSRTEGGVTRYPLVDALGSTVALTDENGAIKTRYAYEPFGGVGVTGPEAASSNPYQFTGRENDGTGLYFYRARYYDPNLQRFIAEDPIGLAGGINLYAYVENNPLRWTDPTGKNPLSGATWGSNIGTGIGGLIGGPPGALAGRILGAGIGAGIGYGIAQMCKDIPGNKPPFRGDPDSTVRAGTGSRTYSSDGYPKTDRDLPHPDECGIGSGDHCHDWGRPPDGSPPTHDDRGPPRLPQPDDPPAPRGPNVPPP